EFTSVITLRVGSSLQIYFHLLNVCEIGGSGKVISPNLRRIDIAISIAIEAIPQLSWGINTTGVRD
ncbi:MAG: hypothetical protein NZ842_00225, partial [Dehalococcoidia bacterium]|nr:hypothetical protein [Dehalococcoidia bacterium]